MSATAHSKDIQSIKLIRTWSYVCHGVELDSVFQDMQTSCVRPYSSVSAADCDTDVEGLREFKKVDLYY